MASTAFAIGDKVRDGWGMVGEVLKVTRMFARDRVLVRVKWDDGSETVEPLEELQNARD